MSKFLVISAFLLLFFVQHYESAASPWVDTTYCSPLDSIPECNMKKAQCAPINQLMKAKDSGGLFKTTTKCSNMTGVALNDTFFYYLGMSFIHGNPESILDNATTEVRQCVVNSTGLFGTDMKFNRTSVINLLALQPLSPDLIIPVLTAVKSCPEPINFEMAPFMSCIRKECMDNATGMPAILPKKKKAKPTVSPIAPSNIEVYSGPEMSVEYAKYLGLL